MPLKLACAAAVLGFSLGAPGALAATATVTITGGGDQLKVIKADLAAAPGERNQVEVTLSATDVSFRDTGTAPTGGNGCTALLDTARCAIAPSSPEDLPFLVVSVRGGDGDDRVRVLRPGGTPTGLAVVVLAIEGGEGSDELAADTPAEPEEFKPPGILSAVDGGPGDDVLTGGDGADFLAGGPGRDNLKGLAGDDSLSGDGERLVEYFVRILTDPNVSAENLPDPPATSLGDDVLDGGPGRDQTVYAGRKVAVKVDISDAASDGSPGESDTTSGIEDVHGGDADNELRGDAGPNRLIGGEKGTDLLVGGAGNDQLLGYGGSNRLEGGAGDDHLFGPGKGSRCGAGRDAVSAATKSPLDGSALRRDCELVYLDYILENAALRLRPLRESKGVLTIDAVVFTSIIDDDRKVTFKVAKPGGATLGTASVTLPKGSERGQAVRLKVKLGKRARSQLGRLRRVRLTATTVGSRTVIDLPLR